MLLIHGISPAKFPTNVNINFPKRLSQSFCLLIPTAALRKTEVTSILLQRLISIRNNIKIRDKWVPVTTAWRVLRLWMEERRPIWTVTSNIWNKHLIFVVPSIMLYSSEISPTICNNCVFILRNGFTLHVSGDNLTHHQEYICCIWPQVSRLT